jgi:hypothetical protein
MTTGSNIMKAALRIATAVILPAVATPAVAQTTYINPNTDGSYSIEQGSQTTGYLNPYPGYPSGGYTITGQAGRVFGYAKPDGSGGFHVDWLPGQHHRGSRNDR